MTTPIEPVFRTAERFFDEFTLDDAYHWKRTRGARVRRLVFAQYVEPEGDGIHVEFSVDSDDLDSGEDAEVQALATKAIDALRQAHPELAKTPIRVTFA